MLTRYPPRRTKDIYVVPSGIDPVNQVGVLTGTFDMLADENLYQVTGSEVSQTPGWRYTFLFTTNKRPDRLIVVARYIHLISHYKKWMAYDYGSALWVDLLSRALLADDHPDRSDGIDDHREYSFPPAGNFTQNNTVKVRLEHYTGGAPNAKVIYFDMLKLLLR